MPAPAVPVYRYQGCTAKRFSYELLPLNRPEARTGSPRSWKARVVDDLLPTDRPLALTDSPKEPEVGGVLSFLPETFFTNPRHSRMLLPIMNV